MHKAESYTKIDARPATPPSRSGLGLELRLHQSGPRPSGSGFLKSHGIFIIRLRRRWRLEQLMPLGSAYRLAATAAWSSFEICSRTASASLAFGRYFR